MHGDVLKNIRSNVLSNIDSSKPDVLKQTIRPTDILKTMRSKNFNNSDMTDFKDISNIKTDDGNPTIQRILKFIDQAHNPYLFRVGNTPVKIVFSQKYAHMSIDSELAKIVSGKS